jgi:hypothetical protein
VQALLPAARAWPAYFARAATAYGIFGVLFAFVIAYAAYGFALAAAAVLIKWILVGRVKAGVHKYAYLEARGVSLWYLQESACSINNFNWLRGYRKISGIACIANEL